MRTLWKKRDFLPCEASLPFVFLETTGIEDRDAGGGRDSRKDRLKENLGVDAPRGLKEYRPGSETLNRSHPSKLVHRLTPVLKRRTRVAAAPTTPTRIEPKSLTT